MAIDNLTRLQGMVAPDRRGPQETVEITCDLAWSLAEAVEWITALALKGDLPAQNYLVTAAPWTPPRGQGEE